MAFSKLFVQLRRKLAHAPGVNKEPSKPKSTECSLNQIVYFGLRHTAHCVETGEMVGVTAWCFYTLMGCHVVGGQFPAGKAVWILNW